MSKQLWAQESEQSTASTHVATLTLPFIPNGTSHYHWISEVFPRQRKEKQICKEGTEESGFEKGRSAG